MTHDKWENIQDAIEAMADLEAGPLFTTIERAGDLAYAMECCDWPCPISVSTRRSLGADSDDGITLTWRGSDNTFSDIAVWDERDT